MGYLTNEEIQQLRNALEKSGLTYTQLQDELLDHLICDIEAYMQEGLSFQQAWQKVNADIPKNQFKNIQTETMEVINKKIGTIKIMIFVSFFLLVSATIFKLLHLQGTDMLLLAAFGMGALTILVASFKGFYANSYKKGRYLILFIGLLIIIFIVSIVFQVLQWKGGIPLRIFSMTGLTLLFPALSIYFFRSKRTAQDHSLILLMEENRIIIERVVLALVSLGIVFKLPVLLQTSPSPYNFAPMIFLILAIFIEGLYIFTFTWKPYVSTLEKRNNRALIYLLLFSIAAFVLFMLPGMPWVFSESVGMPLALIFYILFAPIVLAYYLFYSRDKQRYLLTCFSFLVLLIPLLRLCVGIGVLSGNSAALISEIIYNVEVFFVLIVLLIVFYKKPIFRAFMLLMLAEYMYTYPVV